MRACVRACLRPARVSVTRTGMRAGPTSPFSLWRAAGEHERHRGAETKGRWRAQENELRQPRRLRFGSRNSGERDGRACGAVLVVFSLRAAGEHEQVRGAEADGPWRAQENDEAEGHGGRLLWAEPTQRESPL